ncbi:MoaD/ThiS family protein [Chloroflexota bacterium]
MFRCVVGIFGLPHEITELQKVEIELKDGASLRDVIAALRREIPTLEGHVVCAGEDKLMGNYAFNINGHFYFDDREIQLHNGDHIALLSIVSGG